MNKKNYDKLIFRPMGGVKVDNSTLIFQTDSYIRRKLKTTRNNLDPSQRQLICYVLHDVFSLTINDIKRVLPYSTATLYSDTAIGRWSKNKLPPKHSFHARCDDFVSWLLSYSRYTH